jgi:hypothetical protein
MTSTRPSRYRSDARLWAHIVDALRESMPTDRAELLARRLVAMVRREQQPGSTTWGPGDPLPVVPPPQVFDLDGVVWERDYSGHGCYCVAVADRARLADIDGKFAGVRPWPRLLETEGPLTAIGLRGGVDG